MIDAFFDLALEDDLQTQFTVAIMNTDAASVAEIFTHPRSLIGLSDAGAHLTLFCEAGQTSRLLGHWVRERRALSLEDGVRRITSMPADLFGLRDRGRLAPGLAADITVFDPRTIADHEPELVHDLPGAARGSCSGRAASSGRSSTATRSSRRDACPTGPMAGPGPRPARDMKFGIFYEHQLPGRGARTSEYRLLQESLDQIELADRLGYDYAWEVEHHFLEEYSHSSAPGGVPRRGEPAHEAHPARSRHHPAHDEPPGPGRRARVDARPAEHGRVELGIGEGAATDRAASVRPPRSATSARCGRTRCAR